MTSENRRLWLIDASYLFEARSSVGTNYHFDYKKLREKLEEDGPIWRAYYLNATQHPPTDAQDSFHTWLRSAPPNGPKIITKLYELKRIDASRAYCERCERMVDVDCPNASPSEEHILAKQQQKGVDVGLATLALTLVDEYNTLILSSGDGDLLDAIEYICQQGKRFELAVFSANVSTELQARADHIYWIDDFKDQVRKD